MKPATTTAAAIFGRPTPAKRAEQGIFWVLRLATYFVLFCAAFIFWDIGTKGGAVIFKTSAPFINVPFLTEAPETLAVLRRQRTRWQRGLCEVLVRHRAMLFNPRYGRIGLLGLPMFVLFDILGPLLDLAGLVLVPLFWWWGLLSFQFMAAFFAVVVLYGVCLSMMALVLGEVALFRTTRKRDMLLLAFAAVAENFGYRQLNILWRIEGIWQFLRKQKGWGEMTRTGFGTKKSAPPA